MDPEARRRACVEFRVKLSRDTEVNLTASACASLLGSNFTPADTGEEVTLHTDTACFYWCLGQAITFRALLLPFVVPYHMTVAAWCYRQATEVQTTRWV
jgi:hypothetical protein